MTAPADGTALYRIHGEGAVLLYIGISDDFGRRWKEHAKDQPWWDEMRRLTVDEWFASRWDAEEAEETAIKAEQPKYNKRFSGTWPTVLEDLDEVLEVINRMTLITPTLEAEIRAAAERSPKRTGHHCMDADRPCLRSGPDDCYGGFSARAWPCVLDAPWSEGIRAIGMRWVRDPAAGWHWKPVGRVIPPGML